MGSLGHSGGARCAIRVNAVAQAASSSRVRARPVRGWLADRQPPGGSHDPGLGNANEVQVSTSRAQSMNRAAAGLDSCQLHEVGSSRNPGQGATSAPGQRAGMPYSNEPTNDQLALLKPVFDAPGRRGRSTPKISEAW